MAIVLNRPARVLESQKSPAFIGVVTLRVRDLDRVAMFYCTVMGLAVLAQGDSDVTLGTSRHPLLRLIGDPSATIQPRRSTGLFHTAFLMPTRADLADWLEHVVSLRTELQGASDHTVSEAFYLADPEDNGIEVYVDRDRAEWNWDNTGVDMDTGPMNVPAVRAQRTAKGWTGIPADAIVGHVHMRVGDLDQAQRFYGDALGMEMTHDRSGARFFSWGGYHHHIGANVWSSAGAPPRDPASAGLAEVTFVVQDPAFLSALPDMLATAGCPFEQTGGVLSVNEPWGVRYTFAQA
jgi:catechol 2,3-dioxygenase